MAPASSRPAGELPAPSKLRIGIMCNGLTFPTWQAQAIHSLLAVEGVELSVLVVNEQLHRGSKYAQLADHRHLFWMLYSKGYMARRSRASRPTDMSAELGSVQQLRCVTVPSGRFGEQFHEADVDRLREMDLDVLLRFGFGIIKGDILSVARYGVWSYHHGDERVFRGQPPAFWEMVTGEPVVGAILQRLTERLDGGVVLHRGFSGVTPHSYVRTRDEAFLESADWPSIVCRQILNGRTGLADADPSTTDAPIRHQPTNWTTLRFLTKQAGAFATSQWRGLTRAAEWTIGVSDAPVEAFLREPTPAIRWMPPAPRGRYLADPFALRQNGSLVALVEEYDYASHRGVISALALHDRDAQPQVVIDPGVHASYPFLFESEGDIWCVPETYQAKEVRLYRALQFPHRWEHATTLVTGVAALDPTVISHGGRWWLFLTDQNSGPNSKLRIWHAPELTGPWQPHALNPVKTDIRSSRPAGTPFVVDGVLYRPAQDGSRSYGGGITINRVDVLSDTAYSEEVVATIAPPVAGPFSDGIHTICGVGEQTVVDGRRDVFIAGAFRRELRARIRKLVRR